MGVYGTAVHHSCRSQVASALLTHISRIETLCNEALVRKYTSQNPRERGL